MDKEIWEIGEGTIWDGFTDEFGSTLRKYIAYGVDQCENVTKKQLTRQFLKRIAGHYGAKIIFNDTDQPAPTGEERK